MKPTMNKMSGVPRKRTAEQMSKEPSPPSTSPEIVPTPGPTSEKFVKISASLYEKMAKSYYKKRLEEKKRHETQQNEATSENAMFKLNYELNSINHRQQETLRKANSAMKYHKERAAELEQELKDQKKLQQKIQQCNLLRYHIIRMEDYNLTKYHLLILYYDREIEENEWKRMETEFPRPITSQIAIEYHDYFIKRYKIMRKLLKSCKCLDDETTCDGCREIREWFSNDMIKYKGRRVRWGFTSELKFITETDDDFETECAYE